MSSIVTTRARKNEWNTTWSISLVKELTLRLLSTPLLSVQVMLVESTIVSIEFQREE